MNHAPAPLLRVRNLVVSYRDHGADTGRRTAVDGVSLDIGAGRIVALVGESGSGKTSLAHAILRLVATDSGQVLLQGRDLVEMNAGDLRRARRDVQAVFQDPQASLNPRRTILKTLLEPLDHFGVGSPAERPGLAARALARVGLAEELLQRYPHQLSGGQLQRAALARALACGPRLIVADEPLSSLDAPLQQRIGNLLLSLRDSLGTAFLLVTHDLGAVRRLADDVAVMYAGQLVEAGPAGLLLGQPAHPYTRALLAAVPVADPALPGPRGLAAPPPDALTRTAGCVFHSRCPERFGPCASEAPGESSPSQSHPDHRVRCHLWKT